VQVVERPGVVGVGVGQEEDPYVLRPSAQRPDGGFDLLDVAVPSGIDERELGAFLHDHPVDFGPGKGEHVFHDLVLLDPPGYKGSFLC
jgi:hypothetical protein